MAAVANPQVALAQEIADFVHDPLGFVYCIYP